MKIPYCAALAMAAVLGWPALAAPRHGAAGGPVHVQMQMQRERHGQPQQAPQRGYQRPMPVQPPPQPAPRGYGRMTDDERRGLQRDLDRANREIYKGQRR